MSLFRVLVSRHKYEDEYTTQLPVFAMTDDRSIAIMTVREYYPPEYIKFYEDGVYLGIVAHFTGEVALVL
jgi:hypothetical protein